MEISLTETLRPHVLDIEADAERGDSGALLIVKLHQLHVLQPNDPGAAGLCAAAFDSWLRARTAGKGE